MPPGQADERDIGIGSAETGSSWCLNEEIVNIYIYMSVLFLS